jgi:4-hydroxy-tetrahydrodipicolinate reductase
MPELTRVALVGVTGRMGQALVRASSEFADVRITGAVASSSSPSLGRDAGELAGTQRLGVAVTSDLRAALDQADVAIDFSQHQATRANLAACQAARKPLVLGTTGFSPEVAAQFDAAGREIPLLVAPNTSLGVTLLLELVRAAARALPSEFDIEIIEAHHRMKVDAPSGTALALGRAAAEGRVLAAGVVRPGGAAGPGGGAGAPASVAGDAGTQVAGSGVDTAAVSRAGRRREGDIGYAVVRGGDIVGEHTVLFAGLGEQLSLGHRATDRTLFARGALRAALWLASRPPGRYAMRDLLADKTVT